MVSLKLVETDAKNPKGMFTRAKKPVEICNVSDVKYVLVMLMTGNYLCHLRVSVNDHISCFHLRMNTRIIPN